MTETQHGRSHGHATGIRWLDVIAGVSAIFISVLSLVVSIEHGRTMERMVRENQRMVSANTLPFLTSGSSELDPETNQQRIRMTLHNGGVGPAVIDWFEVRYKGVAYDKLGELLRACCAAGLPKDRWPDGIAYANVTQTIVPARDEIDFIDLRLRAGRKLLDAFDNARGDIAMRACYCSVLDECWETDFSSARPRRAKECHAPEGAKLW
jgi:hypothetical protein